MSLFSHIYSKEVVSVWENEENCQIIDNVNYSGDYVVIYFSSNGIYFPNTLEEFKKFISKNKYEWYSKDYRLLNAKKIIYFRDVYKQWYLKGINKNVSNIDDLIAFIKKNVADSKVICIGSSAGGYIATLVGAKINAETVYSFSGQFTLENILNDGKDVFVNEMYSNYKKYYNLTDIISNSSTKIFYFVCGKSNIDNFDIDIANNTKNIYMLKFDCKIHGVPFALVVLPHVLHTNISNLIRLSNLHRPISFIDILKNYSLVDYWVLIKKVFNKISKKIRGQ